MAKRRGKTVAMDEQWGKIFGAQVREKRVRRGLTQQELAEMLGFATHGTIAQIEMGNVVANFDVACQLAVFLGISLDAILGLPPPAPMSREWYSDMLMLRLPSHLQGLWPPHAQQEMLTHTVEELGRVMRRTMTPPQGEG